MQLMPEDIIPCLFGKLELEDGEYDCEGMDVARVEGGKVVSIACDGVGHGWNKVYAEKLSEFYRKFGDKVKRAIPEDCQKCGGTGWLAVDSREAQGQIITCLAIGLFRGIDITDGKDRLTEFLNTPCVVGIR